MKHFFTIFLVGAALLSDLSLATQSWRGFEEGERSAYRRNRQAFNQRALPMLRRIADDLGHRVVLLPSPPAELRLGLPQGRVALYRCEAGKVIRQVLDEKGRQLESEDFDLSLRRIEFRAHGPKAWEIICYRDIVTEFGYQGLDFATFNMQPR